MTQMCPSCSHDNPDSAHHCALCGAAMRKLLGENTVLCNRYKVVSVLGWGAMAAVYLADDQRLLGRRCAVKENRLDPSASPEVQSLSREQFLTEAKVLARLDHPNLPKVSDYFIEDSHEYLVMDYILGEDLDSQLGRAKAPLEESIVLDWADQVLDALSYLHNQVPLPVIHRDIKPANLRPDTNNRIKLVDFGLVKLFDSKNPATKVELRGLGTPSYAPLEQFAGSDSHTDPRSDIYALGATMYHLLTNVAPPNVHERLLNPEALIPPGEINSKLNDKVQRIVLKAMGIHPTERYQSADEMRKAIRNEIITDRQIIKTTESNSLTHRRIHPHIRKFVIAVVIVVSLASICFLIPRLIVKQPSVTAASGIIILPTYTPYPTHTTTPTATVSPTQTPSPTSTSIPIPTSTPIPIPTLSIIQQSIADHSQRNLLTALLLIPIVFAIFNLTKQVRQHKVSTALQSVFLFRPSMLTGFSIVLFIFGASLLLSEQVSQVGSFSWLLAWLLIGEDFYPGLTGPNPSWGSRSRPVILLAIGYVVCWYGYMAFAYSESSLGIFLIYLISLLFLIGAKFRLFNPTLRARLADDLFVMVLIFTLFVFIGSLGQSTETLPSLTKVITINLFWDLYNLEIPLLNVKLIPVSIENAKSLFYSLTNNSIVEYYAFAIVMLFQLLNLTEYDICQNRKIPIGIIWFILNLLGIVVLVHAIKQTFIGFMIYNDSLLIAHTTINLVTAMLGVLVLVLAKQFPESSTDEFLEGYNKVGRVEEQIHIDISAQKVMATLLDVRSADKWTPNLKRVTNVRGQGVGCSYQWEYKIGKWPSIRGETEIVNVTNSEFIMKTTGAILSTWIWTLYPSNGGTDLQVVVEYSVPGIFGGLVDRINQKTAPETLQSLKVWLEK